MSAANQSPAGAEASPAAASSRTALLWTAGWCGLGVMTIELTTTRALAPWFGASHYTWTNVIGVVLLALSGGYWLGGRLADRNPDPRSLGRILLLGVLLLIPAPFLTGTVAEALLPDPAALPPQLATAHVVRGSLAATLCLFALPLMLLGMTGPFVTRLLVDRGLDGGQAAGRTLAVSTAGSLIGTYLPAHVLIESFGVRATLLIATAAVGVGVIPLFAGRARAITAMLLLGLPLGLALASSSMDLRGPLPAPDSELAPREVEVIEQIESSYQHLRLARWSTPTARGSREELRLVLDEGVMEYHSVKPAEGVLTGSYYDLYAVLPQLLAEGSQPSVVVLGGGAGTIPRLFRELHGDAVDRIVSVEIDPAVAALCPRFGWQPDGQRNLSIVDDARFYLRRSSARFDLIVLDAYARQIAIPAHLGTVEFFRLVSERLADGGVFALNLSVHDLESPLSLAVTRTLKEVFPHVAAVSVPDTWNVVLLASADAAQTFLPREGSAKLAPLRERWLSGLMTAVPSNGGLLLTDDRAPLERLAREG